MVGVGMEKPGFWDHLKSFNFKAIVEDFKSQDINWMEIGGYVVESFLLIVVLKDWHRLNLRCKIPFAYN